MRLSRYLILIFISIITLCYSKETKKTDDDNKEEEKKLTDVIKDVALTFGSPELKAALELLHTESSTTISDMHEQTGFYSLTNVFDVSSGVIDQNNIGMMVKFWLDSSDFNMLSDIQKKLISRSIEELLMFKINNKKKIPSQSKKFELQFSDGKGKILLLFLGFTPLDNGEIMVEKFLITTTFEVAPPYVIVTESDCNILSCDRTDNIVYMPARITDVHTATIINMNIGFMVGLSRQVTGSLGNYRELSGSMTNQ